MEDTTIEYHCDCILRELAKGQIGFTNMLNPDAPYTTFELTNNRKPEWDIKYADNVLSILMSEDFIKPLNLPLTKNKYNTNAHQPIFITAKGRAFSCTDSFVDRKKRWELEKKTKALEYSLKRKTFTIAITGLFVSLFTLGLTIYKYINEKETAHNASVSDSNHNLKPAVK